MEKPFRVTGKSEAWRTIMKKKLLIIMTVVMIAFSMLTVTSFAATPRWTNANRVDVYLYKDSDTYKVLVGGKTGTTKIVATAVLYEKNILGNYVQKNTTSDTYYSTTAVLTGNYDMSTSKNYRVDTEIYVIQ